MELNCRTAHRIDPGWEHVPSIRIGQCPATLSTPDAFVLVEKAGEPFKRLDVYCPGDSVNLNTKTLHWCEWIVVGCCDVVLLVPVAGGETITVRVADREDTRDYFSDFRCEDTFILVSTGRGLIRVEADGGVLWRNHHLGLDGIQITSVSSVSIQGMGDWDPPGGWQPFTINTTTGTVMSR